MSWVFSSSSDGVPDLPPVENTVLLTEAAYFAAAPSAGWRFGSFPGGAAFLQAPGHAPVLSLMPPEAVTALAAALPQIKTVDVDARLAGVAARAWGLVEGSRIRLHRLGRLRRPSLPPGTPRVATVADRPLLVSWYEELMAAHPEDPSELAYVVDEPLRHGGITLWETGGVPVAMAGRSRVVAGMTRLSAVHAPGDPAHGRAALVSACAAASEVARDVLIFTAADDDSMRELGFEPVLDRVVLVASA